MLLAPHHGSGTSSTLAFLQAVAPEIALFQLGYHNRYHHPKPEVLTVLGDPDSDKAKKYWRNLGLLATLSSGVRFSAKPAVAVLPSKAILQSAAPDVVDPALALGPPLPSASAWCEPAASVRRSSVRGFKFRMKEPLSKRRLKLALRQFSKVDPSRAWVQFSPEDRRALVLAGENLPERLAAIISSAEHHQVTVPARLRNAYDRVTEPIVLAPTVDDSALELEAAGSSIVLPASVVKAAAAIRPGASVVMLSQLGSDTVGVTDTGATIVLANVLRAFFTQHPCACPSRVSKCRRHRWCFRSRYGGC